MIDRSPVGEPAGETAGRRIVVLFFDSNDELTTAIINFNPCKAVIFPSAEAIAALTNQPSASDSQQSYIQDNSPFY